MRSEIRTRSTSANSAKSVVMTFVWMSRSPSTRMFSFSATKATPGLGESVEDRHDLTQRPAEPRELADDQAVAAAEDARQLVEPPTLLKSLPGGSRLDEVIDAEVVLQRARMARRWLLTSCCGVETRR